MKYFIDTEFIEGFHEPLFGKRRHFIDLISIGIVCEDGREYYAISNEFQRKDADKWVNENVIDKIEVELFQQQSTFAKTFFNFNLRELLKQFGKSNKQIATEIMLFVWDDAWSEWRDSSDEFFDRGKRFGWSNEPIEFYGYYADYDWVLFCSLFGRMIDLPKDFPMYCNDLKQTLDKRAVRAYDIDRSNNSIRHPDDQGIRYENISGYPNHIKEMPNYPKQTNEHNALADAKWNKMLYEFLKTI